MNEKLLLPAGFLLELLGILTLITNDGMLIPDVGLGFSMPAVLPPAIQGMLLLLTGSGITFYSITQMQ